MFCVLKCFFIVFKELGISEIMERLGFEKLDWLSSQSVDWKEMVCADLGKWRPVSAVGGEGEKVGLDPPYFSKNEKQMQDRHTHSSKTPSTRSTFLAVRKYLLVIMQRR